jgi:uncharacterized protein (TIGR02145 family)
MKFLFSALAVFFYMSCICQTTYTFNGNGNWSDSANWLNRQVPPDILSAGSSVIISPLPNGECVVDIPVYITRSSGFIQQTGSKIRVINDLILNRIADSFNLTDYDIQYLDGISASNPSAIILKPVTAGNGNSVQHVMDVKDAFILSMLNRARELSAEKQQIFPAGPAGSVPNQPAHYGYAYRFGGNADDKDITTRRVADNCDEAHAADAVKGTDATGFVINLIRQAGVTMPLASTGQFALVLSRALSSSVNANFNRIRLDSLGFVPQNSFLNGDLIIWPSKQHMGILYDDGGLWKVFNSNGNPYTNTHPGCSIPDPGNSNNCLQLRTPAEEQGLNLGQARGIHPIKFTNAIDAATDEWGTGYTLYRLENVGITTGLVTNISGIAAQSGGTVVYAGRNQITARGICWSTRANPLIENNPFKTSDGNAAGPFSSNLTGLDTNRTYYVRSYVTIRNNPSDKGVTYYGNQVEFRTPTLPTLSTAAITDITLISAVSGGIISNDGGSIVTARGVCWSISPNPTIDLPTRTLNGAGVGSFVSNITGLTANTIYYVRAYAVNDIGVAYGNELSFAATFIIPPFVSTLPVTDITTSTAVSGGNVSYDGGSPVTQRGVCWSTFPQPTDLLSTKTMDGSGLGNFTSNITGLAENTLYYVRAYAINAVGPGFGEEITFTTPGLPTVTTAPISNILLPSATSGGDVTDDGRSAVTARGVCWSTSPNPTVASAGKTIDGSGTGAFLSTMSGLAAQTIYYVRAYASNDVGTAYGNELSFTTPALPTVSTTPLSQLKLASVVSGGTVTDDGGSPVTQRGVCWSASGFPTVEMNTKTVDGSGTGTFISNLTGLLNVGYFVRAYATNAAGTAYGNYYYRSPLSLPEVTSAAVSQITTTSAVSGGSIFRDGNGTILGRGVCWSTSDSPTVALSTKTVDGGTGTAFISNMSGLSANTAYKVRAYATNDFGTGYGSQSCFTASEEGVFTDARDGKQYPYKRFGTQVWMTQNLNYAATGSWCYNNNCTLGDNLRWGRYYKWSTALTVAPAGWHLPSDAEWQTLIDYLGGEAAAGTTMKSNRGMDYGDGWFPSSVQCPGSNCGPGNNCSGWSGLPGGYWHAGFSGFSESNYQGRWWSSNSVDVDYANFFYLIYSNNTASKFNTVKNFGLSVRCIRNY